MKPIIYWTIRQRKWSLVAWSTGVIFLTVMVMALYPSFRDQAASFEQTFADLPDAAKGLISDTNDFLSPVGYLSSQLFYLTLPLVLGIFGISLGAHIVAREERDTTIELLLARPVSRLQLISAKALAALLMVGAVVLLNMIATLVISAVVSIDVPLWNIALACLVNGLLVVVFGAVAFAVTMLGRGAKTASVGFAALVSIGGYIISSLSNTVSWLELPAKALPFHYYQPGEILSGVFGLWNIVYLLGVVILCGTISVIAFRRRDLASN